jgi:DNA-binding NarL/FixJ family response regulator
MRDGVQSAEASFPDVIVVDITLMGDDGPSRELQDIAAARGTPIVYLTATSDAATVERAAHGHGAACVVKPFGDRQLVSSVLLASMSANRGGSLAARATTLAEKLRAIAAVVSDLDLDDQPSSAGSGRSKPLTQGPDMNDLLSSREKQIVDLLANGARVVTIAQRLALSPHTVRNHLKSVFRKLNLHGQHELYEYWHHQAG